ncbi:hypothetical protein DER29_6085 [Micromonospora sp. M71_S20]|nr:hypothetical protein DER29_6085 [Micromonospora sp. M71_S20]
MWPSGRLHLPAADDAAAVCAVKAVWATQGDRGRLGGSDPAETLADIAWEAAASAKRGGDWIEFSFDEAGDPKWSDAATAFYVAIGPFVREGTVHINGGDGSRWSYTYADGRIAQQGWNGWDASVEPFGEPQDPPVEPREPDGVARPLVKVLIGLAIIIGAALFLTKVR